MLWQEQHSSRLIHRDGQGRAEERWGENWLRLARAAMALEDLSRSSHVRGGEVLWENAIGPGRAAAGRKFPQQRRPSARGLSCVKFRGLHK